MSTSRGVLNFILLFAGYIVLNFFLIIVQGVLHETGLLSYRLSWLPFLLLHLILITIFFVAIWRRTTSPQREVRWLQEHGRPASARLLDIQWTGWRKGKRGGGSLRIGHPGGPIREYRLRLEVTPAAADPYEVTTHQYLPVNALPKVGSTVPIKIHPQHPDRLILDDPLPS